MKRVLVFFWGVFVIGGSIFGSDQKGTTGASFLKVGVGARGLGMGEAYTAISEGADALYWNPAGLLTAGRPSVMFTYNPLVEGVKNNQASFSYPSTHWGFGVGYNGFTQSSIDSYDSVGNKDGTFQAGDQLGLIGFSVGKPSLAFGVTGKYWSSSIDNVSVNAFAADAGLSFDDPFTKTLRHALVMRNAGSGVQFITQKDPLPLTFLFGNALKMGDRLILSADVGSQKGVGGLVSGGLEWNALKSSRGAMALRGGYTTRRNQTEKLGGASFGIGFLFGALSFDYAWIPYGELGDAHAVTLVFRIPKFESTGKLRNSEPDSPPVQKSDHHRKSLGGLEPSK